MNKTSIKQLDKEFRTQVFMLGKTVENLKTVDQDHVVDWLNVLMNITESEEEARLRNDCMHYLLKSCINGELAAIFREMPSMANLMVFQDLLRYRMEAKCWTPVQLIETEHHKNFNYALLVLNTKIEAPRHVTCSLWQNARHRVLVDGGTNRWLSFLRDLPNNGEDMKSPDTINGDFDSVDKETLDIFKDRGSTIKHTPDQNETDFTKALRLLEPLVNDDQISSIIALQEHGTRFDHIMANINTLFKATQFLHETRLYLLSGGSLTWLLTPGKHSIQVPSYLVDNQRWCSMIPIGGVAKVTTKGFKWDLNNDILEFGKLVSTSNTYASESLEITTDTFLVWSMGIFNFD